MYVVALERKANGRVIYPRKEIVEQQRLRNSYEKRLNQRLVLTFRNIGNQVGRDIENGQRVPLSLERIESQIGNVLTDHYRAVFLEFAERTQKLIIKIRRKEESDYERYVQQYLYSVGGTKITQISETTRANLMKIITKGQIDGLGQNPIANQIRDYSNGSFTKYRARMIARTETHQASVFANHRVSRDQEIPDMQKRWISTNDNRTRLHHRQLNGVTLGMEEDFVFVVGINQYRMSHPADPRGGAINNINCRCVLAYVIPEDSVVDPTSTTQTTVQQVSPFGDTTEDELGFHENADWNTSSDAYKTIKHIDKVNIKFGVSRAYADGNLIAMSARKTKISEHLNNDENKTTWRHEFGHVIDTNKAPAIKQILRDNNLIDDLPFEYKGTDYISGYLLKDIYKDRKFLNKYEDDDIRVKANKDMEKFGLTGIKRDSKGKIVFVNTGDLKKADYDMSTKEIINKEFKGTGLSFDELNELADGKLLLRMSISTNMQIKLKRMAIYLRSGDFKSFLVEQRGAGIFNPDMLYFSDYIEAISNARIGYGHGKSYYQGHYRMGRAVTVAHTTEAMANYVALTGGARANIYKKLMETYAPNMTKSFEEMFKFYAEDDMVGIANYLRGKAIGD